MDVVKSSAAGCLATQATTRGEGVGLISSESTLVSRTITDQIPGPDGQHHDSAAQVPAHQTPQIGGGPSPPGFPLLVRKRLERNAKSPWLLPPWNGRDAQRGPLTVSSFSRRVVESLV